MEHHRWKYREGFAAALGIALTGILLQLSVGNIEKAVFVFPVNLLTGILFIALLLFSYFLFRKKQLIQWLASVYATIPAVALLVFLCIVLGILPQFPLETGEVHLPRHLFTSIGWFQMTSSWPFLLSCFYFLTILGFTILKRTKRKPSWRDIGFYLNHLGLFTVLLAGILGNADTDRLTISIQEGATERIASDRMGKQYEMPFAVRLDSFIIDEYAPRLLLIENRSRKALPVSHPESYMIEGVGKGTTLAGVVIKMIDYLPHAAIIRDSSAVKMIPVPALMKGAVEAIKVEAGETGSESSVTGWISSGSYLFSPVALPLDATKSIAVSAPEVKKYRSYVTVYTKAEEHRNAVIEVNKPLSMGEWKIYQYSYDKTKGKYSDTSIFEVVRDPWLGAVYTGIFMLMAGALFLFISGPQKKRS